MKPNTGSIYLIAIAAFSFFSVAVQAQIVAFGVSNVAGAMRLAESSAR